MIVSKDIRLITWSSKREKAINTKGRKIWKRETGMLLSTRWIDCKFEKYINNNT